MAPTTEPHTSSTDLGQRFFLLGIFGVLVAEVLITLVNYGQWFEWTSCVLGIIACVGILYLGNWLYTGNTTALMVTRGWVVLRLMLVLVGVLAATSSTTSESPLARQLGINVMWEGYLLLAVYLGMAALLFLPGVTLDFFGAQRGEHATTTPLTGAAMTNSEAATASAPVELTAEHTKALDGLGGALKLASGAFLTIGVFEVVTSLLSVSKTPAAAWLGVLEGAALAALGAALLTPTKAVQSLLSASPKSVGYVMNVFISLMATCKGYLLLFLVLAVIALLRLIVKPM
jgi:hypothetical protein